MKTVTVKASETYDVLIGNGLMRNAGASIAGLLKPCRAAVITDETVACLFGETLKKSLEDAGFSSVFFTFSPGEKQKNMQTLCAALEWLGERRITSGDLVIALGGGVAGDVAGFAAAVYQRGIPYAQIPTTLLAAVDSSVGGKTAVNLSTGKNLAGAFYQPRLVLCDTEIMGALPPALESEGLAEILKYGILRDETLFAKAERGIWKDNIEGVLADCIAIKRDYVEQDERDQGVRRYLNLGHTFGHAIEKSSGYEISHGQAVGMGLMMAARAAGMETERIENALRHCGLPVEIPFTAEELCRAALHDKKRRGQKITLVLPERIGKCRLETVPVSELLLYFRLGTGESR